MTSSLRSGPERRRTPVAHRQADNVLDIGVARMRELGPAARAGRGNALRHGGEAQAQQRRRAAVAARSRRAAQRGRAERAARGRHGAAFRALRGGNNWLQDFARAGEKRNDCASRIARPAPRDARCASLAAAVSADKTGERATDRVAVASRCYDAAVMTMT